MARTSQLSTFRSFNVTSAALPVGAPYWIHPETESGADLRHFYNQFFARDIAVKFLFPEEKPLRSKGHSGSLCGACGHFRIGEARQLCSECGTDRVVTFFVADSILEERKAIPSALSFPETARSAVPVMPCSFSERGLPCC